MARLTATLIATLFCLLISDICDWRYPVNNEYYNEFWDAMKHVMYLGLSLTIGAASYLNPVSKYKIVTGLNDLTFSLLIFGIIPTMMLEKDQNRFKPHEAYDYVLLAGSLLIGLIFFYARKTKTDTN